MSEDQQLTVAELLARAQKDNPEAGKRRRRRRSLEEGGVSVAELTGSLKRVDARPPEPKHSSVPIDPPEEQAKDKASGAASAPREVEVEKVEVKRPAQSAAADSADAKSPRPQTPRHPLSPLNLRHLLLTRPQSCPRWDPVSPARSRSRRKSPRPRTPQTPKSPPPQTRQTPPHPLHPKSPRPQTPQT